MLCFIGVAIILIVGSATFLTEAITRNKSTMGILSNKSVNKSRLTHRAGFSS